MTTPLNITRTAIPSCQRASTGESLSQLRRRHDDCTSQNGPGPNYPFREAVVPTPGLTILAYPVTGMVDETTMRWNKSSPETRHGSGPALASELFTGDSYHGQYETGPNQPQGRLAINKTDTTK